MTSPTSIGNSPSTSERPTFDQQPSVTVNGYLSIGGASGAPGGSGDGIRNFDHAIDILLGKGDSAEDDTTLNNKRGGNSSSSRRKVRLFEFTDVVTVADDSAIKYLSGIVAQTDKIARASVSGGGGGGSGPDAVLGGPQINPQ